MPRVWLFVIHHEGEETADDKEYAYPVFNNVEVNEDILDSEKHEIYEKFLELVMPRLSKKDRKIYFSLQQRKGQLAFFWNLLDKDLRREICKRDLYE